MVSEKRAKAVAEKLSALWGEGLPPGADPYELVAQDALFIDDEEGRAVGLIVQGEVPAAPNEESVAANRQVKLGVDRRLRLSRSPGNRRLEGAHAGT